MRKLVLIAACCLLTLTCSVNTVYSSSLDAAIQQQTEDNSTNDVGTEGNVEVREEVKRTQSKKEKNQDFINELNEASDLSSADVGGVDAVNSGLKTVAAFIVQVLAYGITIFLAAQVLLDLTYITFPFLRNMLSGGKQGNPMAGSKQMQQGGMQGGMSGGMGGMGMNGGMGMGGMSGGMGGYGRGSYGMGGMGMGGMQGGMGMNNMNQQQPGMSTRTCWVAAKALNAVAAAEQTGENPYKLYADEAIVKLVVTPIFVVLAATGALTQLGLMLGTVIAGAVETLMGML